MYLSELFFIYGYGLNDSMTKYDLWEDSMERTYCSKTWEQMNKVLDTVCELEDQYQGMTKDEEEAFDIAILCTRKFL